MRLVKALRASIVSALTVAALVPTGAWAASPLILKQGPNVIEAGSRIHVVMGVAPWSLFGGRVECEQQQEATVTINSEPVDELSFNRETLDEGCIGSEDIMGGIEQIKLTSKGMAKVKLDPGFGYGVGLGCVYELSAVGRATLYVPGPLAMAYAKEARRIAGTVLCAPKEK